MMRREPTDLDRRILGEDAARDPVPPPNGLLPNVTPSAAYLSQEDYYEILRRLVKPGDFEGWGPAASVVAQVVANAPDARAFEEYLKALFQAMGEDMAAMGSMAAEQLKTIAELQFHLVLTAVATLLITTGLGNTLAGDNRVLKNLGQFLLGILEGLHNSGFATAASLETWLTNNAILTAMAPLSAVALLSGAVAQMAINLGDACALIGEMLTDMLAVERTMLSALQAAEAMAFAFLTRADGTFFYDNGKLIGFEMGKSGAKDLIQPIDFQNPLSLANLKTLLTVAFNWGTYIGELLIDVIMSLTGFEFVAGVMKALKATGAPLRALQDFVKQLVTWSRTTILDDLGQLGAEAALRLQARLAQFIEEMSALLQLDPKRMEKGFEFIEKTLGDGYKSYLNSLFCRI